MNTNPFNAHLRMGVTSLLLFALFLTVGLTFTGWVHVVAWVLAGLYVVYQQVVILTFRRYLTHILEAAKLIVEVKS